MTNKEKLNLISKCKTVDEVIELAKKNGHTLTKEKADELFNKTYGNVELADEELNNVSGGSECHQKGSYEKIIFPSEAEVNYILEIGQKAEVFITGSSNTITKTVDKRKAVFIRDYHYSNNGYYIDAYHFCGDSDILWAHRNEIEKPK